MNTPTWIAVINAVGLAVVGIIHAVSASVVAIIRAKQGLPDPAPPATDEARPQGPKA